MAEPIRCVAPTRLNHVGGKGEGAAEDAARDPGDQSESRHGTVPQVSRYVSRCRQAESFPAAQTVPSRGVGLHCDLIDRGAELPHRISRGILRARHGRLRFPGFLRARFVDHPLEQAPHRDTEARRLCLDPGAPLVIEPDAHNGGLCGRHDSLTVTRSVYNGGAEWWQPGGGWSGPGVATIGSRLAACASWPLENPSAVLGLGRMDDCRGESACERPAGPGDGVRSTAFPRGLRRSRSGTRPSGNGPRVGAGCVSGHPGRLRTLPSRESGVNGVTQDVYTQRAPCEAQVCSRR